MARDNEGFNEFVRKEPLLLPLFFLGILFILNLLVFFVAPLGRLWQPTGPLAGIAIAVFGFLLGAFLGEFVFGLFTLAAILFVFLTIAGMIVEPSVLEHLWQPGLFSVIVVVGFGFSLGSYLGVHVSEARKRKSGGSCT